MLMSHELDEYPDIIYYRTERNRSRRAYYIEIESIEAGKTYAEFNSEIIFNNLKINTKNCTGLKIILPPQIDRDEFFILINNKRLQFKRYDKNEVLLKHFKNKGFQIVESLTEEICYYRGAGLFDVYYSPLRIINCNLQHDMLNKVSDAFAHSVTNTAYTYIYVDYPIQGQDAIDHYTNYALIVVDNNSKANKTLAYIRLMLPIQMNQHGYTYNGRFVYGKYCIMQIIANPWNHRRSILYINTNDPKLYGENLFTRKIVIPSNNTGTNPFLTCVALLYDEKKYYAVTEWGNPICEIK